MCSQKPKREVYVSAANLHFPAVKQASEASRTESSPESSAFSLTSFFMISKMASQQRRLSGYAQLMPSSHTPAMTASFPDAPLCLL